MGRHLPLKSSLTGEPLDVKAITPELLATWKDQMRRYKTVIVPVDDFAVILEIIEGRSHGGCFCPHCNPQKQAAQ